MRSAEPEKAGQDEGGLVLTVAETARLLRIGVNECYKAIERGEIPGIKIGRTVRVPRAALTGWLGRTGGG
jgi:DNA binding domain, excisionase family